MKFRFRSPISFEPDGPRRPVTRKAIEEPQESKPTAATVPSTRQTRPQNDNYFTDIKGKTTFVTPGFIAEYIPIIRKLSWINEDMGLAVNDMVRLTNTGHRIKFDPKVTPEQQAKMRQHIENKQIEWGDGVDGLNGLVNKLVAQIWISGALSGEWVVSNNKDGVKNLAIVNPETIVFSWNKKQLRYEPYQKQTTGYLGMSNGSTIGVEYVKLNENTYRYYGINGDTELPYGIPPFLTALTAISTQQDMNANIRYIMKQVGLLGFFEALMTKPSQNDGESETQYIDRLNSTLDNAKKEIIGGIGEGVIVGYKEDHEFTFNSTTKDLNGVSDIFNQNERQVANGLKYSQEFLGIGGSKGSEGGIGIVFTKMLSQLTNIQTIVAAFLKFGYTLELRLAGFDFENLRVEFNPSTITDELKYQQGQEIKIRNVIAMYGQGIISQQQSADSLGFDKPDQEEPRILPDKQAEMDQKREADKDKSDRAVRDKNKPIPKRKDTKANIAEQLIDMALDLIGKEQQ
jgi:hypothetical protein